MKIMHSPVLLPKTYRVCIDKSLLDAIYADYVISSENTIVNISILTHQNCIYNSLYCVRNI